MEKNRCENSKFKSSKAIFSEDYEKLVEECE